MAELPPDIAVTDLPDGGVRFTLPVRPMGPVRYTGVIPVAFGLVFAGMGVAWMATTAAALARPNGGPGWAFVLAGTPFLVIGLVIALLGLATLAGHSVVEVSGGRLWAVERVGPLRWRRWRRVEQVRRFTVAPTDDGDTPDPRTALGSARGLSALAAACDPDRPLVVAPGYPRAWLRPLAEELARRCQTVTDTGTLTPAPPVSESVEPVYTPTRQRTVTEQPAGSRAVVDEDTTGVTITLPPAGLGRGTKGVFPFAVVWCLFIAGFTTAFTLAFANGQAADGLWIAVLVLTAFWLVGVGLLLGGFQMGRRRAVLAVVGDRLLVLQSGPLGSKRREWPRAEVARIAVGPSGMAVNDVPVLELQIHPKGGSKVGLLAGRDEAELHWLATRLRQALKL